MPALLNSTSIVPELGAHGVEHPAHRVLVGDVAGEREVDERRVVAQVDADDRRALLLEAAHRLGADAARRARDHADLPVEPAHQPPVA